jgi:hypothetical protein
MANNLNYSGVNLVKDPPTQSALRLLWDAVYQLRTLSKGPTQGTLNPDQKPVLGMGDAGVLFYAVDFNRLYRWTGSSWVDDATAPSRFQIAFFAALPEPATGWVPCDGRSAARSTSSGGTAFFTTPVVPAGNGFPAYIRV